MTIKTIGTDKNNTAAVNDRSGKWPLTNRELVLLFFIGAVLIVPIWIVKFPVLLDYPAHLTRVNMARKMADPIFNYAAYYTYGWYPRPYMLFDLITYAISFISGVFYAGKIVLTIYVFLLLFGTGFFLKAVKSSLFPFILWPTLVTYNWWYSVGTVNFLMGTGFCVIILAYSARRSSTGYRATDIGMIALLFLLTILCHPTISALTLLLFLPLVLWKSGLARDKKYLLLFLFTAAVFAILAAIHMLFKQPWNFHETIGRFNWLLHDYNPPLESRVYKFVLLAAGLLWLVTKKDFLFHGYWPLLLAMVWLCTPTTVGISGHNEMRTAMLLLICLPLFVPSPRIRALTIMYSFLFIIAGGVWMTGQVQKAFKYQGLFKEVESFGHSLPQAPAVRPLVNFEGVGIEFASAYITMFKGGYYPFIPNSFFHGLYYKKSGFCPDTSWDNIDSACAVRYDAIVAYTKYQKTTFDTKKLERWGFIRAYKGRFIDCFIRPKNGCGTKSKAEVAP